MSGGGCSELEPYALQVKGDSMSPEFWDGCIIIVDPGAQAVNGAYVVIDVDGDTLFRQFMVEGGRRYLKALNEEYPATELAGSFNVRGVVVQRAGRRRSQHKHYV
jgi:SOS-response transcriptional repressor LexA